MTGFDTNVLIYACDKADPRKQDRALELLEAAADGVILWQVACEFVAASRKLQDQGFTSPDAWARLLEFLAIFPLVLPTPDALERARALHLERRFSFWDALILGACLACSITRLYSEDLPGGDVGGLEIVNPFAAGAK